jgi:hypothetical protein
MKPQVRTWLIRLIAIAATAVACLSLATFLLSGLIAQIAAALGIALLMVAIVISVILLVAVRKSASPLPELPAAKLMEVPRGHFAVIWSQRQELPSVYSGPTKVSVYPDQQTIRLFEYQNRLTRKWMSFTTLDAQVMHLTVSAFWRYVPELISVGFNHLTPNYDATDDLAQLIQHRVSQYVSSNRADDIKRSLPALEQRVANEVLREYQQIRTMNLIDQLTVRISPSVEEVGIEKTV